MAGKLELLVDGEASSRVVLPPTEILSERAAYGKPVTVSINNKGTTSVVNVRVDLLGEGIENVTMHLPSEKPSVQRSSMKLEGSISPGEGKKVLVRGCYRTSDDEDEQGFELVVRATSVG